MRFIFQTFAFLLLCTPLQSLEKPANELCDQNAKIIIVRHGQADHNINKTNNSTPSSPNYIPSNLTESGKQQVAETAKELIANGLNNENIVAVYVSPLPRTQQTAEVLAKNHLFSSKKIHLDPRLIEVQFGDAEGLAELGPLDKASPAYLKEKNVETVEHIHQRLMDFYNSILDSNPCGNIVVVTHGFEMRMLTEIISDKRPDSEPKQAEASVFSLYCILDCPK